jgi:hypothetical protein
MAGTALRGRLTWQLAELVGIVAETPRVKTIVFDVPGWPGHRAGQHVDVRLTAEDGYQAERKWSPGQRTRHWAVLHHRHSGNAPAPAPVTTPECTVRRNPGVHDADRDGPRPRRRPRPPGAG